MSVRPHGYARYKLDRCRCEACRKAVAAYNRARGRMHARGEPPLVDAAPVRAHARALMAQGMGWKRIAAAAGVSSGSMTKLLYGVPGASRPPCAKLSRRNAEKLLAVTLDHAPHALVGAAATWRRIEALVANGYTLAWIAEQIGNTRAVQLDRHLVLARHAEQIRDVYAKHENVDGPSGRARQHASKRGWKAPTDWADIERGITWDEQIPIEARADGLDQLLIDDMELLIERGETIPTAYTILGIDGHTSEVRHVRMRWVEDLTRLGWSAGETGRRLGLDPRQIARDLADLRNLGVAIASGRHGGQHHDNEVLEQRARRAS